MNFPIVGAMPIPEGADQVNAVAGAQPKADRVLLKEDLWRRYPWTKDPLLFNLATKYEFPTRTRTETWSGRAVANVWSESEVDQWLERMRAKAAEIALFLA